MTDPRKPVFRPDDAQRQAAREVAYSFLLSATENGAKALGCTGASFVIIGLGLWAQELSELDAPALAQMLRSLADIYDPASSDPRKTFAERKRRTAVETLLAAVDMQMATPAGRA